MLSGDSRLLRAMVAPARDRDSADEREEIRAFVNAHPEVERVVKFNDEVGRLPSGPAKGWRERERKAKSCEQCEGDLWIEGPDGSHVPCECRKRRADRRARNRLRAGDWWSGTSLSFAAPPLAAVPHAARDAVEQLCSEIKRTKRSHGLWIVGDAGAGKSSLCAYIAQRLYPSNDAVAERTGNLVAHLRWLGAVRGEYAVEQRMEKLVDVPLLVLDDLDRPIRTHRPATGLAMRESCTSQDLIRLATLLNDRLAASRPTVIATRAQPEDCAARLAAITPADLVRGLLAIASDETSPFEDFPSYSLDLLEGAVRATRSACRACHLDLAQSTAAAA